MTNIYKTSVAWCCRRCMLPQPSYTNTRKEVLEVEYIVYVCVSTLGCVYVSYVFWWFGNEWLYICPGFLFFVLLCYPSFQFMYVCHFLRSYILSYDLPAGVHMHSRDLRAWRCSLGMVVSSLSVCLPIYLSVCRPVCPFIRLSVCRLSVCLSVCPLVYSLNATPYRWSTVTVS